MTALMTFAEFEQLPDTPGKRELIDGEVVSMPPPDWKHSQLTTNLVLLFATAVNKRRVFGDHTGYRIGSGWIEPDASVSWPDQRRDEKYLIGSPMIAVEILSPADEIERKLTLYFDDGALEVWLLDPRRKAMTVYVRKGEEVVRLSVTDEYRSEAAQVTVSLADLFA